MSFGFIGGGGGVFQCLLLIFCFESMEFYVSIELIWFPKHYKF